MENLKQKSKKVDQIRGAELGTFVDSDSKRDLEKTQDLTWYRRFPIDRTKTIEETQKFVRFNKNNPVLFFHG